LSDTLFNLKRDNPTNVGNWYKSIERKISKEKPKIYVELIIRQM